LIPPEAYQNFIKSGSFYPDDIERFASQVGIDAGIVVGRLQHDVYIENSWHNQFRSRYEWKR
ncbi:MAG: XRE family transcriptional regulator, partial [bacterium]